MAYGLRMSVELSDPEMFERLADKVAKPRPFLQACGVSLLEAAGGRLDTVLKRGADVVRSGHLEKSLQATGPGTGSADSIFDLGDLEVYVGSSLPYAAQVNEGGRIEPRDAKALAIPLTAQLQRHGIGPVELDPGRDVLRFVFSNKKPNVIGVLIDEEGELGQGRGPLYALARYVDQPARPYLYVDDENVQVMVEDLWPAFVEEQ